jgi:glutamyl-tRNA synthetase
MDKKATRSALDAARGELGALSEFTHQALEESLRATAQRLDLSPRQFFGVLRVAATGRSASPPLFETLEVLGRERVLGRVESAMSQLD